jgi:hypothetical protein
MLLSDAEELFMTKARYEAFEALNPFFGVVLKGLRDLLALKGRGGHRCAD